MFQKAYMKVLICVALSPLVLFGRIEAAPPSGVDLLFSMKAQPLTVTVSGRVTDKQTGAPIAGASVQGHIVVWTYQGPDLFERCPSGQAQTDAQGLYRLQFVTPLTMSGPRKGRDGLCVYVSAAGYETKPIYAKLPVTPESLEYRDFHFALGPGQRVAGTVVDTEGQPVSEAIVRLQDSSNGDWNFFGALGRTITNEKGQFELWIAKGGQGQWLDISKVGYGAAFVWNKPNQGDLGTLVLGRGGKIQGRVVDPAGKGVAGCEVSVRLFPCDLIDKVLTDSEGRYLLQGVPGDPSLIEFYKTKNGRYVEQSSKAEVRARLNPAQPLADAPTYQIVARDGATVVGPDLVVGAPQSVAGLLTAAHHVYSFGGLLVRLDYDWHTMAEADADGHFQFPFVSPGKHRLTAYLPHNLRYDTGIGHAGIDVVAGQPLTGVQIPLEDLAELRVQYLDAQGNPLPGITAGATWSPDGSGAWTEGTKSEADGWATLYLYPGQVQYVRGFDMTGSLVPEAAVKVQPESGAILTALRIAMVPAASLQGVLTGPDGAPMASRTVTCTLAFADGVTVRRDVRTDAEGRFHLDKLTPGMARLSVEIGTVAFADVTAHAFELKPGAAQDLGGIALKNGLDKEAVAREKNAHALEYAAEVRLAAEQLFEKIRTANYARYLPKDAPWGDFPIVGYYRTDHRFDTLIQWICTTFSKNPIVKVELGTVFLNTSAVFGKRNLPTVPYHLTLQNGTGLEGNLPFEFTLDGPTPHWHGLGGIDWHLSNPR